MCNISNMAAVAGRIVAVGRLKLLSPLLIAEGGEQYDANEKTDRVVLCGKDGNPYIPATSLAGVLKHFADEDNEKEITALLFGTEAADKKAVQSSFIFSDVALENSSIVVRDGVCIDDYTGVAVHGKKYDFELVDKGTYGDFKLQFVLRQCHLDENGELRPKLRQGLERLLQKLSCGFMLGAGTAKGLGRVKIEQLIVDEYDFSKKSDVVAWLHPAGHQQAAKHYKVELPGEGGIYLAKDCVIEAAFSLPNSLIIRDYDLKQRAAAAMNGGDSAVSVAAVSKKSGESYLIPGSSLKGALRKQAIYIAERLKKPVMLVDRLMGPSPEYMEQHKNEENSKWKSRFIVDEVNIDAASVKPVIQVRNSIDVFSGGTIHSKLFATEGIYGKDAGSAVVNLRMIAESAEPHEIGLLLFLLRDLWQGKVALGGEKSVGRGTLKGLSAKIYYQGNIITLQDTFAAEDTKYLEKYAEALAKYDWEGDVADDGN